MSEDVTAEGKRHIDRWRGAQEEVRRAKERLNSAECELSNATNALGRWLVPKDVQRGEKISVWYGDSLICAEVVECPSTPEAGGDFYITVRQRGRSLTR